MKNLIIAALAAAQIMDWWYIYCRDQNDIVCSVFIFFFLALMLLGQCDKYIARRRRMRETSRRIERMITQPVRTYNLQKRVYHGR